MILRPAIYSDRRVLYELANDRAMQIARGSTRKFSWSEHCKWLKRVLSDNNVFLFIAEINGVVVGEVRFDCDGDTADVGLVVRAQHRGHGYGTQMIEAGISRVPKKRYTATIKSDNVASARCFTRAGFKQVSETEWERL